MLAQTAARRRDDGGRCGPLLRSVVGLICDWELWRRGQEQTSRPHELVDDEEHHEGQGNQDDGGDHLGAGIQTGLMGIQGP